MTLTLPRESGEKKEDESNLPLAQRLAYAKDKLKTETQYYVTLTLAHPHT